MAQTDGSAPLTTRASPTRLEVWLPLPEPWQLRVFVFLPAESSTSPRSAVLSQSGPYMTLADELKKSAAAYTQRGLAYIVAQLRAPRDVMADGIFGEQWRGSGRVLLDWLGEQPWSDGSVFLSGWSACGNIAYATLAVSAEEGRPKNRARVAGMVPVCSFSRVHPTVFQWGNGVSIELALRFLWLAELGTRPEYRGISWARGQFDFFLRKEWTSSFNAAVRQRPLAEADESVWRRRNHLFQNAIVNRQADDTFWCSGTDARDVQCDLAALGAGCPPMHFVTGWHDLFLRQTLDDYKAGCSSKPDATYLTIFDGAHLGLAARIPEVLGLAADFFSAQLDSSQQIVPLQRKRVRLAVIQAQRGDRWLECDAWPPKPAKVLEFFVHVDPPKTDGWCCSDHPGHTGSLLSQPASTRSEGHLSYVYDPSDPTPYIGGSYLNLRKEGLQDQHPLERRPDVVVLTSPPLEEGCVVVGEITATLYLSSDAAECDCVARLCVVRAAKAASYLNPVRYLHRDLGFGKSLNLCDGIARVSFSAGEDLEASLPDERKVRVRRVDISLGATACEFRAGDCVRLHVCSAAHPKFLRHPLHKEGEDWLTGHGPVGSPARLELCASPEYPSVLRLPLQGPELTPPGQPPAALADNVQS